MKNLKFKNLPYKRPDILNHIKALEILFNGFENKSVEEKADAIRKMFAIDDALYSNQSLAYIKNSLDATDENYKFEVNYLDSELPKLNTIRKKISRTILSDADLPELKKIFGSLFFDQMELQEKVVSKETIPLAQEENKLVTEYEELLATAKIEFDGKVLNLQQMAPYQMSLDRKVRKEATLAVSNFFLGNKDKIGNIYDRLVKIRDRKARMLGYKDYVQMAYDSFGRTDYTPKDVAGYRKQILKTVVPIVNELIKEQGKRIGIEKPLSYDLAIKFKDGNPTPKGTLQELLEKTQKMYNDLSPQTGKFFTMMKERELLDLDARQNKRGGGYCDYMPSFEAPFIFANFNGTQGDVETLTHEVGHAFQVYTSKDHIAPYRWPTMEAAEIFSMSMEFLTWPWMDIFFEGDTNKFKYEHLAGAIRFLPYGALIDHFQEEVYKNPHLTVDERNKLFRKLEKMYLPHLDYEGIPGWEMGLYWYRQGHVFASPFYYIDYTLAQVSAFQYLQLSLENKDIAFQKYYHMCKIGGSKSFLGLLEEANLVNPFTKGSIKKITKPLIELLKKAKNLI